MFFAPRSLIRLSGLFGCQQPFLWYLMLQRLAHLKLMFPCSNTGSTIVSYFIVCAEKVYRVHTFTSKISSHAKHCSHLACGMDVERAFERRVNLTNYKCSSLLSNMCWCPTPAAVSECERKCTRNGSESLTENT